MDIDKFLDEKAVAIDEAIQKYIPRTLSKNAVIFRLNRPRYSYMTETLNVAITAPIWEFLDRGGKRWRPLLFLLTIEALGKEPDKYLDFAIIPEVIHNGTLIIDDIEDSSKLRRGKPCTYKIFGQDIAINAGNAMYYLPLLPLIVNQQGITDRKLRKIYEIYVREMINLSLGQATDIAWHRRLGNADSVTEEDYMQMCAYKTGTLARMSTRIAATLADADDETVEKLGHFAESIGIAFQMQDDVLDFTSKRFEKRKGGRGQDITEGKRSLLVAHTLGVATTRDKKRLIAILNLHTSDQKLKDEAIAIIEKYKSVQYVRRRATRIVQESWKEINKLLPAGQGKEKLETFTRFLVERDV